jgi:signal transduction histidine kinase
LTSLLDFARPRPPEWREVNLREVLDSVVELVSHSARTGIRFEAQAPEVPPNLVCDREQLAQVIMNLAINAAQAMPQGGTVRLSIQDNQDGVLIEVSDEGVGVPPEHLDRIFDPFFTTKETGTGLGLSVVHQIVSQHGGNVTARRNPDRGMTFSVFFPQTVGVYPWASRVS